MHKPYENSQQGLSESDRAYLNQISSEEEKDMWTVPVLNNQSVCIIIVMDNICLMKKGHWDNVIGQNVSIEVDCRKGTRRMSKLESPTTK